MRRMLIPAIVLLLVLTACSPVTINVNSEPSATPAPTQSAPEPTAPAAEPTSEPAPTEAAPAATEPPAATEIPAATAVPGSGTAVPQTVPTSAANPQGVAYTLIFTEAQINSQMNTAISSTQTDFISSSGISLQNGAITKYTTHSAAGPGGKTVDGLIVIAVSASGCDLYVSVVQATVGQFSMTEARKAALNAAYTTALTSALSAAHDYTCVDSVTIENGVMTVVYH